ncbi:hypothetical protein HPB48_019914 [Haemaphysalis longicornis]|uniref:Uncharacterized protein n=1 Tax=Haemaphysalis longicornis TaxID=44386 RepID=A0A9J6FQ36_HAELO|nr:hypothetical protein HPB48_019914 [Haemaphysalis longicornis]
MAAPAADSGASGSTGVVPEDTPRDEEGTLETRAAAFEEKLDAAICQIAILNQRISDLERLYNRALESKELNIARDEKKRCNHYACLKAVELGQVKEQIEEVRGRASASGHRSGAARLD